MDSVMCNLGVPMNGSYSSDEYHLCKTVIESVHLGCMKIRPTLLLLSMLTLFSCSKRPLETVKSVDLEKYSGTWYEIARLPNSFEKGLQCVTATYSIKKNGKVKVVNRGRKADGSLDEAKGIAWQPDEEHPGRLKVRFFWPFSGDYYIMRLADDYSHVLVGSPSRSYLWVLSRTKDMDKDVLTELLTYAKSEGFQTEEMVLIDQSCND